MAASQWPIQGVCRARLVAAPGRGGADRAAAAPAGQGQPRQEDLPADAAVRPRATDGNGGGFSRAGDRAGAGRARHELWDYLLDHYHYLGRPTLVGEHLKQLVFIDGQVVGCLGWASAAWKIAPRDRYIGWTAASKRTRLHLLSNNVRFLIVPWVRVAHLASKVLALSVRGLAGHWQQRYGHGLVLAETFVDCARFAGTCYRAANWTCVGETQGHAKRGNAYHRHGVVKGIYLYPLERHWRAALTAELAAR